MFRISSIYLKSLLVGHLLEQLLDGHVLLRILLHYLGHGHLEVLLGDVHATLAKGVHAGLRAGSFDLKTNHF